MTTTTHSTFESFDSSTPRRYEKAKWVTFVQYALGVALMIPLAFDQHYGMLPFSRVSSDISEAHSKLVLWQFMMLNMWYFAGVLKGVIALPPSRPSGFVLVLALIFALLWSASCVWISSSWWILPTGIFFLCTAVALMGAAIDVPTIGNWRARRKRLAELKLERENLRSHGRIE